jgi:hypothetical protein
MYPRQALVSFKRGVHHSERGVWKRSSEPFVFCRIRNRPPPGYPMKFSLLIASRVSSANFSCKLDFSHLSQTGWITHRPSAQRETISRWLHTPLFNLGDDATSSAPKGATPRLLGRFPGSVSCPFGTMSVLLYSSA